MEAPLGLSRPSPDMWKEIFAHLPIWWRAMCCRVCKVWQQDLEQPHDILVDYGLGTLCSVLATKGMDEVMRRILLHYPSGIAADLGRMDQVRRFVQRHRFAEIKSVDEWMQLASQEPDAGWLCKGVSKTKLEGRGKGLMRQEVGKPQHFSRLLDTLKHSGTVRSTVPVAYSPDGSLLASAGEFGDNSAVCLWDPKTRERKYTQTGHSKVVSSISYSPDGSTIASGSWDQTVCLWDTRTMKEKGTLKGHSGYVRCVAYSPDGKHIASASDDKTVKVWDAETMEEVGTLRGHSAAVNSVAFSPDSKYVASGSGGFSRDNSVRIWEVATGKEVCSLKGHSHLLRCVAYSPDSKSLASASRDKTVKLWDLSGETPVEKGTLKGHTSDNSECTCTSHDRLYDCVTARCPVTGHSSGVVSVAWSPDGEMLASCSRDSVRLWSKSGELKGTLSRNVASWQHLDPETKALAVKVTIPGESSCSGQYIVTKHSNLRDMVYVHMTDSDGKKQGEPLACFRCRDNAITISCKGTSVVVGCWNGQVSLCPLCGAATAVFSDPSQCIVCVASPLEHECPRHRMEVA